MPRRIRSRGGFWALTLGSIGVVFGDIGTSPLYAFREAAAAAAHGQPITRVIVLGVLSLILWALFIVVTAKYVLLLLRADNNGEGGTLSLMALGQRAFGRRSWPLLALGVIGASMFIGDSMITPAISVLSAVEGLKLATPALEHYVVPLTIFILVVLFSVQSSGTARVASAFGPVMVIWFGSLAVMGVANISDDPSVLSAINPWYGIEFLLSHGTIGMVTLGAVFLAVTGGEALYADLGHFGRKPIQAGWLFLVLPSLLINYFGQGALVLANPACDREFVLPDGAEYLAAAAGRAGDRRDRDRKPGRDHRRIFADPPGGAARPAAAFRGPLYLRSSCRPDLPAARQSAAADRGAAAGPSVPHVKWTGFRLWHCRFHNHGCRRHHGFYRDLETMALASRCGCGADLPFVVVDTTFFSANFLKLFEGAWVPLLFGLSMAIVIWTWRRGTAILLAKTRRTEVPLKELIASLEKRPPHIVKGTAVFLTSDPDFVPTALLHNLKHNKVLHEKNVILTIETAQTPRVDLSRSRADGGHQRPLRYRPAPLWLHGIAERSESAGDRAQARLAVRHHVDVVFRVAAFIEAVGAVGNAAMAESPVHRVEPLG